MTGWCSGPCDFLFFFRRHTEFLGLFGRRFPICIPKRVVRGGDGVIRDINFLLHGVLMSWGGTDFSYKDHFWMFSTYRYQCLFHETSFGIQSWFT